MSDQVTQLISMPTKATYTAVEELMKMVLNSYAIVFLAFFVIDYLVTMWDSTAAASSWRANTQGENVRNALDHLFGFRESADGMLRWGILTLTFVYATYYSVRRWGTSAIALSGPVSVFLAAVLVKYLMNLGEKPGEVTCSNTNLSWGDATWCYIDNVNTHMFIGDEVNNNTNVFILLVCFVCLLLAYRVV
jgi:hypothetical protein